MSVRAFAALIAAHYGLSTSTSGAAVMSATVAIVLIAASLIIVGAFAWDFVRELREERDRKWRREQERSASRATARAVVQVLRERGGL